VVHEAAYGGEELAKQESPVADLFHLERSASWQDVLVGVERLEEHVKLDEEPELYRAFVGWLRELILPRLGITPDEIPQGLTLKEFEPMLAERIDSWNEKLRQQGRQEGEAETLLLLLETRFGLVDQATRDRIAAADTYIGLQGSHVNLGFYHGASLADPEGLLESTGKELRHVKLRDVAAAKSGAVTALLREAISERRRAAGEP
jgi:hypothetical protein